jgi:hypothetical protein
MARRVLAMRSAPQEHPIGRMTSAQAEKRGGLTQIMVAAGQCVTIGEIEPDGLRA